MDQANNFERKILSHKTFVLWNARTFLAKQNI